MTDYNTLELSTMDSEPVELFKFECFDVDGNVTRSWYYCNYFENISYGGNTYIAENISRSELRQSDNPDENQITVEIASTAKIISDNIISYADENIKITVYRQQALTYTNTIFTGFVVQFQMNAMTTKIGCDSGLSTTRRPVLFYIYSQQCMVPLYSDKCGIIRTAWKKTNSCVGISGTTIYFQGEEDENSGYFKAGIVELADGQMRTVQAHYGNRIIIPRPFRDLKSGDTMYMFRGCDHTKETCADIFANIENYKGFPFMPDRTPFAGDGVV